MFHNKNEKISGQLKRYEIMHGSRKTAEIDASGRCCIIASDFLPYNLYLEDAEEDIDILINNITNFYYWCASRVLTLDRQYAKAILNSIGASQSSTDKDRAQIALSYQCLSLTDIFWVREAGEKILFEDINLYENHLDNALVDVALRGRQISVQNSYLIADDLSTNGCFPKAWVRKADGFYLYKDGGRKFVEKELLASRICRCFRCRQVEYEEEYYDGEPVSVSRLMTSLSHSIVTKESFDIYAANCGFEAQEYILKVDGYSYYMMNLLDYLIGNTDRHWGNWGLLIDNETNRPLRLHDLMDFNQAFQAYDTLEGANCQTVLPRKMSQREAAVEAVRAVGINQLQDISSAWFEGNEEIYRMLMMRLELVTHS